MEFGAPRGLGWAEKARAHHLDPAIAVAADVAFAELFLVDSGH